MKFLSMIPQDILFDQVTDLEVRLANAMADVSRANKRKDLYAEENNRLHEIIAEFKRHRFGKRSEPYVSVEQLMFDEAENLLSESAEDEPTFADGVEVPARKRKRGYRKPLPLDLPREVVVIELPEDERVGENGEVLKPIGKEVSEKLHFEPSILKVIEIHRIRYGVDSGDTGKTAPVQPSILPKSMATRVCLRTSCFKNMATAFRFTAKKKCICEWAAIFLAARKLAG